jgi:hypothetical protein
MQPTVITMASSVSAPRISADNQERRQVQTFRRLVFRITPGQAAVMFHHYGALLPQFSDAAIEPSLHGGVSNRSPSVKNITVSSGILSVTPSQAAPVADLHVTFCMSEAKRDG